MTDIFNAIGDLSLKYFKIMKVVGSSMNLLIIIAVVIATMCWLYMQHNYNKEADANNTLH